MLLRIVESDRSLKMRARGRKLTPPKERVSHGSVRLDELARIVRTLSKGEKLLGKFIRGSQVRFHLVEPPEAD